MNYYDRIATLLLSEAKVKPEVLARVKKMQKARRDNEGPKQRIASDGGPPPGHPTSRKKHLNTDAKNGSKMILGRKATRHNS